MILAIVGTRDGIDYEIFSSHLAHYINKWSRPDLIISTNDKGIAALAKEYAEKNNIQYGQYVSTEFFGQIDNESHLRAIANDCTHVIAFPGKKSRNVWKVIKRVTKLHKRCKIIQVD